VGEKNPSRAQKHKENDTVYPFRQRHFLFHSLAVQTIQLNILTPFLPCRLARRANKRSHNNPVSPTRSNHARTACGRRRGCRRRPPQQLGELAPHNEEPFQLLAADRRAALGRAWYPRSRRARRRPRCRRRRRPRYRPSSLVLL